MSEALQSVREQLGEDALILSTRTVNGRSDQIEVVAAIDDGVSRTSDAWREVASAAEPRQEERPRAKYAARVYAREALAQIEAPQDDSELGALREEVLKIRRRLEQRAEEPQVENAREPGSPFLQKLRTFMLVAGVHADLVRRLISTLSLKAPQRAFSDAEKARERIRNVFAEFIRTASLRTTPGRVPQRIVLIGPTGVGKTTTLAKIATYYKRELQKRVGLVSIDTYRLGAIEQLRTFASIARMPLRIAYDPREFAEAIAGFRDFDVVFIDTPGRSPRKIDAKADLQAFFAATAMDEIHLTLSTTTRYAELEEIVEHYSGVAFNRLLLTKVDEILHPLSILNAYKLTSVPISFVTTGQEIPDDLVVATKEALTTLIVNELDFDAWIS